MREYPQTIFILTSRPAGYGDYSAKKKPNAQLFVKPFNAQQRERFIKRWYLCQERYSRGGRNTRRARRAANENTANLLGQLEERPELTDLARNPLLLNMIVNLHRGYQNAQLPKRRTELYRRILQLQLEDKPQAKGIDMLLPASESQQVLQRLALYMVEENKTKIEPQLLLEQLQIHLSTIDKSLDTSKMHEKL